MLNRSRDQVVPDFRCAKPASLGALLHRQGYQPITVTPATHARVNARAERRGTSLTDVLGRSRPFRTALLAPAQFAQVNQCRLPQPDGEGWRSTVRVSTIDDDYFFHSAYPTNSGTSVFLGPDAYRFARALDAEVPRLQPGAMPVADICCGSGAAAILLARRWPAASVFALDINAAALHLTSANILLAGTGNVTVCHSDILAGVVGNVDLIVSNPPYLLDREQRSYRHGGGERGESLSVRIVETAIERLEPGGRLVLYTGVAMLQSAPGDPFLERITPLLRDAGFSWRYSEIDPDVFGEELSEPAYSRVVRIAAVWLVAKKPSSPLVPIGGGKNVR